MSSRITRSSSRTVGASANVGPLGAGFWASASMTEQALMALVAVAAIVGFVFAIVNYVNRVPSTPDDDDQTKYVLTSSPEDGVHWAGQAAAPTRAGLMTPPVFTVFCENHCKPKCETECETSCAMRGSRHLYKTNPLGMRYTGIPAPHGNEQRLHNGLWHLQNFKVNNQCNFPVCFEVFKALPQMEQKEFNECCDGAPSVEVHPDDVMQGIYATTDGEKLLSGIVPAGECQLVDKMWGEQFGTGAEDGHCDDYIIFAYRYDCPPKKDACEGGVWTPSDPTANHDKMYHRFTLISTRHFCDDRHITSEAPSNAPAACEAGFQKNPGHW